MSVKLYGLKNCDSCRKARRWLGDQDIPHQFFDLRDDGLDETTLLGWVEQSDWQTLLNKRGTTWRKLDDHDKSDIDQARATALMQRYPALIKRPILDYQGQIHVGFSEQQYATLFAGAD